ncbi:MAG: hypothetical protein EAZ42_05970 [Verrucomicrobia bacterium]|nr:MAG: hypothetical protein EAZ42_05970 [Verrucomicrobiota bacterium]
MLTKKCAIYYQVNLTIDFGQHDIQYSFMLICGKWCTLSSIPKLESEGITDEPIEDFVDQAAIEKTQIISGKNRALVCWQDLSLSSDSNDFAGGGSLRHRNHAYEISNFRRSSAPTKPAVFIEASLGSGHSSTLKWWLTSMAIIVFLVMISGLWLSLGGGGNAFRTSPNQDIPATSVAVGTSGDSQWQPIADR